MSKAKEARRGRTLTDAERHDLEALKDALAHWEPAIMDTLLRSGYDSKICRKVIFAICDILAAK